MPQPPKVYGTPIGQPMGPSQAPTQAPRQKPVQGDAHARLKAEYAAHMRSAHEQFIQSKTAPQKPAARPKAQKNVQTSMPVVDKIIEEQSK